MEDIVHSGTKGMKWGRRLYQNKDGTLTPLGRIRYRKNAKDGKSELPKPKTKTESVEKTANKITDIKQQNETKSGRPQKEYITNRTNLRRLDLSKLDDQTLNRLKQRLQTEKDVTDLINTLSPKKQHAVRDYIKKFGGTAMTTVGQQVSTYMLAQLVNAIAIKAGADGPIVSGKKDQGGKKGK